MVTILVFDRQSLFHVSLLSVLHQYSAAHRVIGCATDDDLARLINKHPGALIFLGQTPVASPIVTLAAEQGCPIVWIAALKDEYLPLLTRPAVKGIVFRTVTAEQLSKCFTALQTGEMWVQPIYADPKETLTDVEQKLKLLSPRERLIAAYLVEGKDYPEIAAELRYKEGTIRNMISLVYDKFGVNKRHELVKSLLAAPPTCQAAAVDGDNNFVM